MLLAPLLRRVPAQYMPVFLPGGINQAVLDHPVGQAVAVHYPQFRGSDFHDGVWYFLQQLKIAPPGR